MSEDPVRSRRRCPICGRPSEPAYRPFCSARCKDVDLHRWLGGHYAIPVVEEDGGKDEEGGQASLRDEDG